MISFFRKIRQKLLTQNRVTQYLIYAAGEILLVVIGILIALQVNTWNENRKNEIERKSILNNLKLELSEDFSMLNITLERLEKRKAAANYLHQLITSTPNPNSLDSAVIVEALMRGGYVHKFVPSFAIYDEIQNSGKISLIKSDSIKKILATYKSRVEENIRIEGPYEFSLKDFEKEAVYYLQEIPNSNKYFTDRYTLINFDVKEISKDREFLASLKHISYITDVELVLKNEFVVPILKDLENLIDRELNP